MKNITVGLFGTCGSSAWRDQFITTYTACGIDFFNPQVDNWTPELADVEADHLANDDIILFPVTGETAGIGSLAETGFSMSQAMKINANRYFVFMIDPDVNPDMVTDAVIAKESRRARTLVRAHLKKNPLPNVFVCDTLNQMLSVSIFLHNSLRSIYGARAVIS